MIKAGDRYLVTADGRFVAPDGDEYRSVWGSCEIISTEKVLGFKPQRPSTNWFMKIGVGSRHVLIAGCQIHYLTRCDAKPQLREETFIAKETGIKCAVNDIYLAE